MTRPTRSRCKIAFFVALLLRHALPEAAPGRIGFGRLDGSGEKRI